MKMTESVGQCTRPLQLLLLIVLVGGLLGCTESHKTYTTLSGERFHTYYRIRYASEEDYSRAIDSTFDAFNASLNPFDSTSLIAAINRNDAQVVDAMIRDVWETSVQISERSAGSYDVTCSPFINAWGFGFENEGLVTPAMLDSLKAFVGYRKVQFRGDTLIKEDPRLIFNFSSIAKGYCADLVARTIDARGVSDYLVELGGEIVWRGVNPKGMPWRIGVNKPIEDSTGLVNDLEVIVALNRPSGGLATSGNYRNYRVIDGKTVGHTINPLTGYPVQTDVLSATIIASSSKLADGLATACMTMPSSAVPAFMAQFPGTEYLLILGADSTHGGTYRTEMSEGFRAMIVEE